VATIPIGYASVGWLELGGNGLGFSSKIKADFWEVMDMLDGWSSLRLIALRWLVIIFWKNLLSPTSPKAQYNSYEVLTSISRRVKHSLSLIF
jgi:hypothetical protein